MKASVATSFSGRLRCVFTDLPTGVSNTRPWTLRWQRECGVWRTGDERVEHVWDQAAKRKLCAEHSVCEMCSAADDDDVELNVLGCRVDILGTNCDQCVSTVQCCFTSTETVKPVLNCANVCLPNILRTVRRNMIRFLIELLVRRTWFGQFEEFTCSQLACNEMQASAQTCGTRAVDSMIENVG